MSKQKRLKNHKFKLIEKTQEETQKKDKSPIVYQRNKIDSHLRIIRRELTEKQNRFIELALDKKVKMLLVSGPAGTTKAQPLDSEVMTPTGPKRMGDINIGDSVLGEDGISHRVLEIHPQGEVEVVKVSFSDGTSAECCWDHLWLTQTAADRNHRKKINGERVFSPRDGSVKSTRDIFNSIRGKRNRINHSIPITAPVQFEEAKCIIPPYVMGILLGDGCFRRKSQISLTCADADILQRISEEIPAGMQLVKYSGYDYGISRSGRLYENSVFSEIDRLGLLGKYSSEKFVPREYLINSIQNRIDLLRGLMDSDGTVSKCGSHTSFCSSSDRLIDDVSWLVQSLGGIVTRHAPYKSSYKKNGEKVKCKIANKITIKMPPSINPFFLPRKRDLVVPKTKYFPKRYITNIEPIEKKVCQCIKIDSESHLYLTNNFIVTHNTYLAVLASLMLMNEKKISDVLYVRSIVESADVKMGTLPGEADDKLSPYKRPLIDKLDELLPKEDIQYLINDNRVEGLPINYLRGLNWNAKGIVADEMQNCTKKELVTLMTRMGEFSKLFVCGDPQQADINGRSGFQSIFNLFNDDDSKTHGIYTFEFTDDDILRSEIVKFIVKKVKSLG